jgi:hypothetical protein
MSEQAIDLKVLLASNAKLAEFDDFYLNSLKPKLIREYSGEVECLRKITERFERVMDYNVPHGKKLRGLCVYESFLNLLEGSVSQVDARSIEEAKAIGWCVEFVSLDEF